MLKLIMDDTRPNDREWKEAYRETRRSLIDRLGDWEDQRSWEDFYRIYWRLIYSVALKAGLRSDEAFEVVQETILTVAKQSRRKEYSPERGSFKNWLLNITRWRVADQFRNRSKDLAQKNRSRSNGDETGSRRTATLENIPGKDYDALEAAWDAEWRRHLTRRAMAQVKVKISPRQYQIFDCHVIKGWTVRRITEELGVNAAQVYLCKHRVGNLVKKEIAGIENDLF